LALRLDFICAYAATDVGVLAEILAATTSIGSRNRTGILRCPGIFDFLNEYGKVIVQGGVTRELDTRGVGNSEKIIQLLLQQIGQVESVLDLVRTGECDLCGAGKIGVHVLFDLRQSFLDAGDFRIGRLARTTQFVSKPDRFTLNVAILEVELLSQDGGLEILSGIPSF